jgi:dipeptidyl aminopeptidase/acylaminoacyl peptidase
MDNPGTYYQNYSPKRKLLLLGLLLLTIGFGLVVLYLVTRGGTHAPVATKVTPDSAADSTVTVSPTPTPFPFQEMTVPFLKARKYESQLGDLTQVSETGTYTSFLTSYSSDGLRVNGLLTRPKGTTPVGGYPAIVFVHGYIPPQSYQTRTQYSAYVDYLARNGFVVFKIDLRGHGTSEGEASGAYYSGDYIVDTLSARSALGQTDFVNKEKIGLWGHSMAGNVVFRSMAVAGDVPAVAIWAGAVYSYEDFQDYGIDDNSYRPPPGDSERTRRRQELFDTYGQFDSNSSFWRQVPATNYLDSVRGAVSLHHATDDNVVSIEYSRGLNNLLENKTGITRELKDYSSGGHNLSGGAFNQAMQNTVTFFKTHL